jgi:ABC-2 type transport system permease protein
MLGAFDYSFWLVFFSPLLCIGLMHELKASEFQAQRLSFLSSLVSQPRSFWAKRLLLRWLLITSTLVLPVIAFALSQSLPATGLFTVLSVTVLYTLFWTALCALVSLRTHALNATYNAILLTSLWLLLCVILPNLAQLWVHQQHPVHEGSEIALQHRQLVHGAWDLPKAATLDPFYQLYPQWQHTTPVSGRFHWKWYYAFQHMADVNLATQVKQRENSLRFRDKETSKLSYLLPSLWVQLQLESIAKSNVMHLLDYRQKITDYHTQLRHALYPYLFEDKEMTIEAFINLPIFSANDDTQQI